MIRVALAILCLVAIAVAASAQTICNQGPQGLRGLNGTQGPAGPIGPVGPQGPRGYNGTKGDTGATGAQGERGYNGTKGDTGAQGEQGVQGVQGATGGQRVMVGVGGIAQINGYGAQSTWQGVCTDGTYIYTVSDRAGTTGVGVTPALNNVITQYRMDGTVVKQVYNVFTETDSVGRFMSFGGCAIIDGDLVATMYNTNSQAGIPTADLESVIAYFNITTFAVLRTLDLPGGVAEAVQLYKGYYWVCYNNIEEIHKIHVSNGTLAHSYAVPGVITSIVNYGACNGMKWHNDELYVSRHGGNGVGNLDIRGVRVYTLDTSSNALVFQREISPPTYGANQGFDFLQLDGGTLLSYWADRSSNRVIVSPWDTKTGQVLASAIPARTNVLDTLIVGQAVVLGRTFVGYSSGWGPYVANSQRGPHVYRTPDGHVHVTGITSFTGTCTTFMPIFKLPYDWAPEYSINWATLATSGGVYSPAYISVIGIYNDLGALNPTTGNNAIGIVMLRNIPSVGCVEISLAGLYWRASYSVLVAGPNTVNPTSTNRNFY
jgi:hypothetical protein